MSYDDEEDRVVIARQTAMYPPVFRPARRQPRPTGKSDKGRRTAPASPAPAKPSEPAPDPAPAQAVTTTAPAPSTAAPAATQSATTRSTTAPSTGGPNPANWRREQALAEYYEKRPGERPGYHGRPPGRK